MTLEELRKLDNDALSCQLALCLGWRQYGRGHPNHIMRCPGSEYVGRIPDYARDLNACFDVEETLTSFTWNYYLQALSALTPGVMYQNPQIMIHLNSRIKTTALIMALQES